ncbi:MULTISPECIES: thiamine pyrophosphate-binding protein [unclassified Sphingopyxis]|uniref:thiamine pyrophosphate-binding protein n=1 Tax=unclassified Sphingopyxis TaxID=2614943 RepID=UPI0007315153|nr:MULTISPECIES: thiamine pyrophosphate-binding protein [unclassified Sphingopyxis]KTE26330.1 acetolactate synthase [Sphingopyxis sp. H057]KTE52733.1 acetolactate synthase [Sphingopyxis sp. H073]KTE54923.1 acetolactate synthase [Sphingopyxis sp. H071]KTE62383.1 acetolactate synthase [Sphingopyxis sp. H107]KTE65929.1 acetolactate synthase [Sphingopyxis sp. H100]
MKSTNVARNVVGALRDMGVRHVFGVPSGGWVDYMEAIRTTDGIDFVLTSHEGGAGFMADVCGRLTGVPGVCFGTFGPGATNLATGVGGATLDRSPMLALTDEMPASLRGRTVQMAIDHQALFAPLTKATMRIEADGAVATLADAARIALSGRPGAVHVGLPQGMSADAVEAATIGTIAADPVPAPATADIDTLVAAFTVAEKPVLAIGLGAVHARIEDRIVALAERFGLPVLLTPMAKGMVAEDHPNYAGVLFHALSDMVGKTHAEADLVVAVGYDPIEFNYESWMKDGLALASIDVVPADIDRDMHPVVAEVVGAIAPALDALIALPAGPKAWDLLALAERKAAMFAKLVGRDGPFGPCAALDVLRDVLPDEGIMTCDVGAHTHLIGQHWRTPKPGTQIMTNGWSAMGFGLPAAIAAKLSRPDTPVCCVLGDGGFLMTAGELATAVREKLPLVIVIFTDNDLALIRIKQEKKQNPIYGTPVRAEGTIGGPSLFGVPVTVARDPAEFRAALEAGFAADGPVIVEALLDSREYDELVLRRDKP